MSIHKIISQIPEDCRTICELKVYFAPDSGIDIASGGNELARAIAFSMLGPSTTEELSNYITQAGRDIRDIICKNPAVVAAIDVQELQKQQGDDSL